MAEEAEKAEKMNFIDWWNSNKTVKLWVGRVYSVGAAVVIIGALFKIMHFPGAGIMLCVGMGTEAVLFTLGYFDKPHAEYHWDKVFPQFKDDKVGTMGVIGGASSSVASSNSNPGVLSDADSKKLSEGIKNVAETAEKLASLSSVVGSVDELKKTMDNASAETDKFVKAQSLLNLSSEKLATSYDGVVGDMDLVVAQTKSYLGQVEQVNKNLESINCVYELQLKNIQFQSESFNEQSEKVKKVSSKYEEINSEVDKMKSLVETAVIESKNYKEGTTKLAKQVSELNGVYGNMLNALS